MTVPNGGSDAAPPDDDSDGRQPDRPERRRVIDDSRRLVRIAWRAEPRRVVAELVLMFLVGVVGGAGLLMLVPVVNSLAGAGSPATIDIPLLDSVDLSGAPLPGLLGAVVALTAVQAGIQWASTVNAAMLEESVTQHLRSTAYDAVLAAKWSFILDRQRSDIIAVVAHGCQRAGYALGELLRGAVTIVVALVTAAVALLVEPVLSAIAIAGAAVMGAALSTSIRRAYAMGDRFSDSARRVQAVMTDSLDSFRLVRAHDAAGAWREELAGAFRGEREVQIDYVRHNATLSAASQVGLVASASLLVLAAVWLAVPPATIVVVLLLIARLARSVQQLASTAQRVAHGLPAVAEIDDLTTAAQAAAELPDEAVATAGDSPAAPVSASTVVDLRAGSVVGSVDGRGSDALVRLRDVSFHYPSSGGGVEQVSFGIARGRLTALTGRSGSGKSTTADIVLGLLEPDAGQVLVEGRPLTRAGLRAWRARVAYVPQETVLIPGTLRRNLLWSVGAADDDACWHALDRAVAAFAHRLPEGLDTPVGDRGIRLSGGERQRVAIARALLREPDLLVLDEATSSLDDDTESAVLETLASLGPQVTVLVIAHRRSTIDAADHVVALEHGRLTAVR